MYVIKVNNYFLDLLVAVASKFLFIILIYICVLYLVTLECFCIGLRRCIVLRMYSHDFTASTTSRQMACLLDPEADSGERPADASTEDPRCGGVQGRTQGVGL